MFLDLVTLDKEMQILLENNMTKHAMYIRSAKKIVISPSYEANEKNKNKNGIERKLINLSMQLMFVVLSNYRTGCTRK